MPTSPWQQRIGRAEALGREHAFAADILGFYAHTARFQESLYQRLERSIPSGTNNALAGAIDLNRWAELVPHFGPFLAMVERNGPQPLAQLAFDLRNRGEPAWLNTLRDGWSADLPTEAGSLLARAFLQPYAELLRGRAAVNLNGYTHPSCPFCHRKPGLGILRPQGDGASRFLMCFFCLAEWQFRRIVCPGCGEQDSTRLPVYTAAQFDYIRVESCDSCRQYIKTVDLARNGMAEPLTDEIASLPLDLWAQDHQYSKLQLNLLGL